MLKQKYFLTDFFILSAEKQPIKSSWRKIEWLLKVDSQLKSIDIMHFGWNIGKAFGRKRIHTATFIKNVFAHTLCDVEISTIERKMSHTESECHIELDKMWKKH